MLTKFFSSMGVSDPWSHIEGTTGTGGRNIHYTPTGSRTGKPEHR